MSLFCDFCDLTTMDYNFTVHNHINFLGNADACVVCYSVFRRSAIFGFKCLISNVPFMSIDLEWCSMSLHLQLKNNHSNRKKTIVEIIIKTK